MIDEKSYFYIEENIFPNKNPFSKLSSIIDVFIKKIPDYVKLLLLKTTYFNLWDKG